MTTNYLDTLITASPDSAAIAGIAPAKAGTIADIQYRLIADRPYALTSDDLLHAVHRERGGEQSRATFFARAQACLRASPLVKQFGWGIHHDCDGRIALVAVDSDAYRRLLADPAVRKAAGMRSRR